jgi:hypothetical protein
MNVRVGFANVKVERECNEPRFGTLPNCCRSKLIDSHQLEVLLHLTSNIRV